MRCSLSPQKKEITCFFWYRVLSEDLVQEYEIQDHPVLKKYVAGEPCERLYVKNLAKQTTEDELKYIFGRWALNVSNISFCLFV
mgnify:CR=1 FL=1